MVGHGVEAFNKAPAQHCSESTISMQTSRTGALNSGTSGFAFTAISKAPSQLFKAAFVVTTPGSTNWGSQKMYYLSSPSVLTRSGHALHCCDCWLMSGQAVICFNGATLANNGTLRLYDVSIQGDATCTLTEPFLAPGMSLHCQVRTRPSVQAAPAAVTL